jgi:hypothetical protein
MASVSDLSPQGGDYLAANEWRPPLRNKSPEYLNSKNVVTRFKDNKTQDRAVEEFETSIAGAWRSGESSICNSQMKIFGYSILGMLPNGY